MSLSSFVVSRNWASSRLRLLLTLFGIALGVAIVVAIYVMDHNTIQSRLLAQQPQRGRVDLELVPLAAGAPPAALVGQLAALPAVEAVAVWREARGELRRGPAAAADVAVFGLGPLPAGPFAHYALAAGRDLEPADDAPAAPGVLVGAEAARALGLQVGATVTLAEPPGALRTECRDGVLVPVPTAAGRPPFAVAARVVGLLDGSRLGGRNFGQVVVCGVEVARRLQPRGPELFHVLRREGADLDRLSRDLREQFTVMDLRAALIGEGADERAFRNGLKVLGGLALLLGMYVVFQTLSHALVARVKQLGLLRCLGAGAGAITRIFLWDALLLGALGALLGVLLGLGLAWLLRHYEVSSLGLHKAWTTFEIPWYPVGWTYALGVLFTLAGAMFPLVRARQVPALQILQSRGLGAKDDGVDLLRGINLWMFALLVFALPLAYLAMTPLAAEEGKETLVVLLQLVGMLALFGTVLLLAPWIVAWFGGLLLWPLRWLLPMPAWLCGKVVARQSGRIAASVCGLAAVLLALLGLKSVTASLRAEVDQFAAAALHGRVYLRTAPATADEVAALARLPGVRRVDACVGEARGNGFFLRGLAVEAVAGEGGALDGEPELVRRYADERVRGAVISRRLARSQGLRAGSVLTLPDRNGVPVAYQVLAVSDRSGFDMDERAFAVAAPHWLRRDFCIGERSVEFAALHLRDGIDPEALAGPVREALPGVLKQKSGQWIHGFLGRDVDRDFVLFDLLLLLMLVLAGTGLLNGMTIAALGRIRELGVLRALGMARADLRWSFVLEGALVAALASALAIGLAVPMAVVLVRGMNQVAALDAPVTLPTGWLGLAAAAALATGVLAALVPAWRAARQSPSESVRYE